MTVSKTAHGSSILSSPAMKDIIDYMQRSREERRSHLRLDLVLNVVVAMPSWRNRLDASSLNLDWCGFESLWGHQRSLYAEYHAWKSGRAGDCTGLENRQTERFRGFESHLFRHKRKGRPKSPLSTELLKLSSDRRFGFLCQDPVVHGADDVLQYDRGVLR